MKIKMASCIIFASVVGVGLVYWLLHEPKIHRVPLTLKEVSELNEAVFMENLGEARRLQSRLEYDTNDTKLCIKAEYPSEVMPKIVASRWKPLGTDEKSIAVARVRLAVTSVPPDVSHWWAALPIVHGDKIFYEGNPWAGNNYRMALVRSQGERAVIYLVRGSLNRDFPQNVFSFMRRYPIPHRFPPQGAECEREWP